jgi:putative tricarboxylic transport membrane protein
MGDWRTLYRQSPLTRHFRPRYAFQLGFGVLGYFMKMYGFQVGPVILGIILGPLMDVSYRRAMISTGDDPLGFLGEFFTRPISAVLVVALAATILSQTTLWRALTGHKGDAAKLAS